MTTVWYPGYATDRTVCFLNRIFREKLFIYFNPQLHEKITVPKCSNKNQIAWGIWWHGTQCKLSFKSSNLLIRMVPLTRKRPQQSPQKPMGMMRSQGGGGGDNQNDKKSAEIFPKLKFSKISKPRQTSFYKLRDHFWSFLKLNQLDLGVIFVQDFFQFWCATPAAWSSKLALGHSFPKSTQNQRIKWYRHFALKSDVWLKCENSKFSKVSDLSGCLT